MNNEARLKLMSERYKLGNNILVSREDFDWMVGRIRETGQRAEELAQELELDGFVGWASVVRRRLKGE